MPVTVTADGVVAGRAVLTLGPAAGGPLDPAALPATVGGLTPPPAMVIGDGGILLAVPRRRQVLRWDGGRLSFVPAITLPGLEPGDAAVLERTGDLLIVCARGARRVAALHPRAGLVYDDATLPAGVRDLIAGVAGEVLLLLGPRGAGEVWAWRPGREGVRRRAALPDGASDAARLLSDAEGRRYAFDRMRSRLMELAGDGTPRGAWTPVETLRERFDPLPVAVEPDPARGWRLRVPPRFGQPDAPPVPWPAPPAWPAFGPDGARLRLPPEAQVGRRPYGVTGTLDVGPLDGRVPRLVWDRVEVEADALPPGTAVRVCTRTSERESPPSDDDAPWSEPHRLVGGDGDQEGMDVAVLSAPGRYLWVRLELEGGSATPSVRAVTAGFPRRGIVDYLPAVFREQDQDTRFLERFVGALEQTWAPLEDAAAGFDRQLRPETATPAMLAFLASWLDQPLEPEWGAAARRRAVAHAADHLFLRGTPRGVQAALRLHLAARRGVDPERLRGQPFIWEHFRSRRPARADAGGAAGALFGSEVLRRLRLGTSALGDATLRDLGAPHTDAVSVHAHRFTVFVPRALAPGPDDVAALQAVLRREQPAGAVGDVVIVEPRMRLGAQATLGVDTTLGIYPTARLAAAGDGDAEAARLDYDCLLADADPGAAPPGAAAGPDRGALPWRVG
jgi:phage tail-like protein